MMVVKIFAKILGQCDEPMQIKVEDHQKEQDCDVAALLEVIKVSAFDSHKKQYSAHQAANGAVGILPPAGGQNNCPVCNSKISSKGCNTCFLAAVWCRSQPPYHQLDNMCNT
jgi:hypothetical protein